MAACLLFVPEVRAQRGVGAKLTSEERLLLVGGGVYAIVAPLGLYGAVCMVRGRKRGWAMASAILLLVGFPACFFSWIVSIWALVALNRTQVSTTMDDDF
jgi:hypothetical protein